MPGRTSQLKLVCGVALAAALAGCGGARQDASEPSGTFQVAVPSASFPTRQDVGSANDLNITVRNDGDHAVPNVAVTIHSANGSSVSPGFSFVSSQTNLADPSRPIWIVDGFSGTNQAVSGAISGTTAYDGTWALGRLAHGGSATFKWHLTAVTPGTYTVSYRIAGGLNGKAIAKLANGNPAEGTFRVRVASAPSYARVDPTTGKVVRTNQPTTTAPGTGGATAPGY